MESLTRDLMTRAGLLEAGLVFFTLDQAATVDAIAGRFIPGDEGSPGAREAGVTIYIDRGLAGYFSSLQTLYREGLGAINAVSNALFGGEFLSLDPNRQDEVLRIAENARHEKGSERLAQFFAVIWEHTIEGMFGDPIHGGNRNLVGWRLIGFPGAQWGYSPEQMAPGFDATTIPGATLADRQRQRPTAYKA
jgi:gluconate 2-dehydrogenase gamma chain